ncbi:protein of unknown function [Azospirillum baldaniorum]|uniref:Uncharacterized protein n=1 Tax=Azospirillum baldaniorum TaxID=1064539 RepID=A0A9P1JPY6_9PROT|nr:protein of unknown function [Azospirillum baldaniorum]
MTAGVRRTMVRAFDRAADRPG